MKEIEGETKQESRLLQWKDVGWYGMTLLILMVVYVGTGKLGLSLGAVNTFATLIWLPSGLAVAALSLWGIRLWPAIALGAFLTNHLMGAPALVAGGISIGNTLEAVVCAVLLKHAKVRPALNTVHDVLGLVLLAAPISTLLSATFGVGSLFLGGVIGWSSVPVTWSTWWLGNMMSLLLLTPLLFTWSTESRAALSRSQLLELGFISLSVLVIGSFVFLGLFHPTPWEYPATHLVFPPLIWAALRLGPRGTTAATATFAGLAIVGTIHGVSPFSTGTLWLRLLFLHSYLGVVAATALILATIVAERRTLEQRKDDFIVLASHELLTPLTGVLGYTQLLQRRLAAHGPPETLRTLARIETQARHLSRLVTELFDLSKILAGKLTFVEETVDMDILVREVVEHFQHSGLQQQIRIEGSAPGTLVGDRGRLMQVVGNLLSNAIKYSPQAEQILIRLASTPTGLVVSIQDFGIGIPKAEQKKIFERFYRTTGGQHQTTAGLGIGLSIAYQIIQHYRGKLWVESVEGQGSTFSFSLPGTLLVNEDTRSTKC